MGGHIMQACFWGKGNWAGSSRSSSIFLWQSTVIWDGCSQHLGSLIASSQTHAICIISGLACVKRQEKQGAKCLWAEFLVGEATPLRSCKAFSGWQESWWPLTRCFTSYLACERAYGREKQIAGKSWGHLVVLLLIFWNRALAALRCKVCCSPRADTVRGVLQACWILGITAESSAPRAADHAACPLWEWDSRAPRPARLRLCSSFSLKFHMPPSSIYVAFACPSQGLISFPRCSKAGGMVGETVCAEACDLQEGRAAAPACAQWGWVFGATRVPPARNAVLRWDPHTFCRPVSQFKRWMQM